MIGRVWAADIPGTVQAWALRLRGADARKGRSKGQRLRCVCRGRCLSSAELQEMRERRFSRLCLGAPRASRIGPASQHTGDVVPGPVTDHRGLPGRSSPDISRASLLVTGRTTHLEV